MYSKLRVDWALPITHEKMIHRTSVQEIFYTRIFVFLFFALVSLPILWSSKFIVIIVAYFVFVLIFYPLFIKPWEIVLSNKRLILRNQYWNIGRFSTLISFNLDNLDTQQIAPRFKLIPVTIGFAILTTFSLTLLEFYLTNTIPIPLLIRIGFLVFGATSIIQDVNQKQMDFVNSFLSPFKDQALMISIISVFPAVALIIFGLPRRQRMILSTTGGHQLSLSTGVEEKLTNLLFAVGRKHRMKESTSDWKWDLPLLDDEKVVTKASIGLIERKAQILGLLSLIVFIESIDQFFVIITQPNFNNFILFFIKVFELLFIWFALVFAKKYRRLIATSHRLLYQEELKQISGLWGKRIYQYRDFPYEYIQGFTYSNFSAFQLNSVFGILILLFGLSASTENYELRGFTLTILLIIIIYSIVNYKNFTSLSFSSIGGGKMELFYKLPVFMVNISHRIENRETLYNRFFPNILSEYDVVGLCNAVRNVKNPIDQLEGAHQIEMDAFVSKEDEEYGRWNKVGQFRFSKGSVFLGMIFSMIALMYIYSIFESSLRLLFLVFSVFIIVILGLNLLIQRFRTLIILKNRLFFTDEILPRKVTQIMGRLPERSIQELNLDYVLASQFRFTFGHKINEFIKYVLMIGISLYTLYGGGSIIYKFDGIMRDFIILLAGMLTVASIIPATKSFFENLPKYSLIILTRFGNIIIPYMRDLDEFNEALNRARGIK